MNGQWNQSEVDRWYNENLARGVSKSKLDAVVQQQQADYLVKQGMPAKELQTSPIGLRAQTQEVAGGTYKPEEKTSSVEQKRISILNQAAPVLNRVIESAMRAPTGLEGAWKAKIGEIPGVSGGEAEFLSRDIEGFARLIASAFASEVGVATNKDVERWKAIMPRPGDTFEERVRQSQKLIDQITNEAKAMNMDVPSPLIEAAKLLPATAPTKYQKEQQDKNILQILFPQTTGLIQRTGEDIRQQLSTGQFKTSTPQDILGMLGGPAGQMTTGSEAYKTIEPAGKELGAYYLLPKILGKIIGGIRGKTPSGASAIRTATATEAGEAGAKLSANPLVKAVNSYAEKDPFAKKLANKVISTIENKEFTPIELLDRLEIWNKAYTAAGKVGKSAKAGLYNALAKATRKLLAEEVPKVFAAQKGLAGALGLQTFLKRLVFPTAVATGTGLGVSMGLGKILGQRRE